MVVLGGGGSYERGSPEAWQLKGDAAVLEATLVFFDEQLGSEVGAIDYVKGSGNRLLTSTSL